MSNKEFNVDGVSKNALLLLRNERRPKANSLSNNTQSSSSGAEKNNATCDII
jgi:hypothetical protein